MNIIILLKNYYILFLYKTLFYFIYKNYLFHLNKLSSIDIFSNYNNITKFYIKFKCYRRTNTRNML